MKGKIKENVYAIGVQDWDRELFDEIIPLPNGTSYNSYLIKGSEKTVLIDSTDPSKTQELMKALKQFGVETLDYLVANHAEQDHSGSISCVLYKYPEAKVVTNEKCKQFLKDLLLLEDDVFTVVGDGDTLSLGDKTLEFILAPWVHWPETMLTYLREDKILFPCDLFGSHLATTMDYVGEDEVVLHGAKRYYAEIMMPFRNVIKGHMEKLKNYDIEMICSSHGPLYDKPSFIMDAYNKWISDEVQDKVIIPYVSMHGSTKAAVEELVELLTKRGVDVKPFNLTNTDVGELAISLVDAATIVVATPTFLVGPHPSVLYAVALVNALRPKTRYLAVVNSYSWGGTVVDNLKSMMSALNAELLEPVQVKGYPDEEDMDNLKKLADDIVKKHKEDKLIVK